MNRLDDLIAQFSTVLKVDFSPNQQVFKAATDLIERLPHAKLYSEAERGSELLALVNEKFGFNDDGISSLYAFAASIGVSFNYHEKLRIKDAFDRRSSSMFDSIIQHAASRIDALNELFVPITADVTIHRLHLELTTPTLVRKDSKPGDRTCEILNALFGGFVFRSFPMDAVHRLFDPDTRDKYEPDFWAHLHTTRPTLFSRDNTLVCLQPPAGLSHDQMAGALAREFPRLANHGFVAIHYKGWDASLWRSIAYVTLFAEKYQDHRSVSGYFRPAEIERATRTHVPLTEGAEYEFDRVHTGYHYTDTFVFTNGDDVDALVLFQKNVADETLIPCPACRSHSVRGNSYSSLGVKSWECENPLCPERSKFNRGKRYSFLQLLKQHSIEDRDSQIAREHVRSWARDVQTYERTEDVPELLLRHYCLANDGVTFVSRELPEPHGRRVEHIQPSEYFNVSSGASVRKVLSSSYFKRFLVRPTGENAPPPAHTSPTFSANGVDAYLGDSRIVMSTLPPNSIDGAVTSPPYYNAREYSQWPNIYCYLYDMHTNAREMFSKLRPGSVYLFNIFDYFDNENNVSLSAMGKKRMILSAYFIHIFEEIGFTCEGNIVWDKGDIEGKRAFNGGNFSPYYQAPFNCWEHILVLRKPGPNSLKETLPTYLPLKPVLKMVRGENRHGHTAPFPEAIPRLLVDRLVAGSVIMDPYAGSMTTGRAVIGSGVRAICIEQNEEYFLLGKRLTERYEPQPSLI